MSNTVIAVENLSKKYQLGSIGYGTLRHDLQAWMARIRGKEDPNKTIGEKSRLDLHGDFWALKDINFQIGKGERVGIVGKNGAGKSTLLKILSRITLPTTGVIRMKGRFASLLEVGTGFHAELTGRENVYLNGAIMGMRRREIQKKFDEIVDFSGVEQFIDTPVKRYSSGMFVRLAFAVSAHLEPDILMVDEVLAVGDLNFQKKCLGKMEDVSKNEGRTILFVSHNMTAIASLCSKCVLLSDGQIVTIGDTVGIVQRYYQSSGYINPSLIDYAISSSAGMGDEYAVPLLGSVENRAGTNINEISRHESFRVRMRYRVLQKIEARIVPNFHFFLGDGSHAFVAMPDNIDIVSPGDYEAVCEIPAELMNEGFYSVGLAVTSHFEKSMKVDFFDKNALSFYVVEGAEIDPSRYNYGGSMPGSVRPRLSWDVRKTDKVDKN